MKQPTLEAHENWLTDLESRVLRLEGSLHHHEPEGERQSPIIESEWSKRQWSNVLRIKAEVNHLTTKLSELNTTLQEHLKTHWDRKKVSGKKNVIV